MIKYLKSKTIWLNIITVILAAANAYFEVLLSPAAYAAFTVVYASIAGYVRALTVEPLSRK